MENLQTIHPEFLALNAEQLRALYPYLAVFLGVALGMVVASIRWLSTAFGGIQKWLILLISVGALALSAMFAATQGGGSFLLFNGMLLADRYVAFFQVLIAVSALFSVLGAFRYLDSQSLQYPEYYLLVLLSSAGMMLMAAANDLVIVFIALEIMSLPLYALVAFRRADRRCNEAAIKYFILGSVSSAIFLYGTALLFGACQSTGIPAILKQIQGTAALSPLLVFGAMLTLVGFLFKVAAVPFHMWLPDVYEGAPTPVTGFMIAGVKAGAFAAFLRVFLALGYGHGLAEAVQARLHDIFWVCAILTMLVGNVLALVQTNLKRMLGYSSVAHTGYLLVGFLAGSPVAFGYGPIPMYLAVYAVMNVGAFIVLTVAAGPDDAGLNLHDFSGLAGRHPWLAFAFAVFLFSLAGIPPTGGFVSKYLLFYSAVQSGEIVLAVVGVLCSVISIYYYLRVLVYMYMRDDPEGAVHVTAAPAWAAFALALLVFLTLQFGMMPERLLTFARLAVAGL